MHSRNWACMTYRTSISNHNTLMLTGHCTKDHFHDFLSIKYSDLVAQIKTEITGPLAADNSIPVKELESLSKDTESCYLPSIPAGTHYENKHKFVHDELVK